MSEEMEIQIVEGKAEVTKIVREVSLYDLEELDHEIQAIQNDIDRLEAKKLEKEQIRAAFDR